MEEWGPWIEHDGMGTPTHLRVGDMVEGTLMSVNSGRVISGAGVMTEETLLPVNWTWGASSHDVIRYRVRRPRGLTVLEDILRETEDA